MRQCHQASRSTLTHSPGARFRERILCTSVNCIPQRRPRVAFQQVKSNKRRRKKRGATRRSPRALLCFFREIATATTTFTGNPPPLLPVHFICFHSCLSGSAVACVAKFLRISRVAQMLTPIPATKPCTYACGSTTRFTCAKQCSGGKPNGCDAATVPLRGAFSCQ